MMQVKDIMQKEDLVNYPQTKDLWASDFIADCPWKGLTSAPSV